MEILRIGGVNFSANSLYDFYLTDYVIVVAENDYDFKPYVFASMRGPISLALSRMLSGEGGPGDCQDFVSAARKSSCVTITVRPVDFSRSSRDALSDKRLTKKKKELLTHITKFSTIRELCSYGDSGYNQLDLHLYKSAEERYAVVTVFPEFFPGVDPNVVPRTRSRSAMGIPVEELRKNPDGSFTKLTDWPSASEAARHYGCCRSAISKCCLGYTASYSGRYFRYADVTQSRRAKRLAQELNNKKK